jgi:hypothetical protein
VSPAPTPPVPGFDIKINFSNIPTVNQALFTAPEAKWEKVIVGDLPTADASGIPDACNGGGPGPAEVDDLYICAQGIKFDDTTTLAVGLPAASRPDGLPFFGSLQIDFVNIDAVATDVHDREGIIVSTTIDHLIASSSPKGTHSTTCSRTA